MASYPLHVYVTDVMCLQHSKRVRYPLRMANSNPLKHNRAFTMRVDGEFLSAVKELQRLNEDVPTKSDAIRRAVLNELERKREAKRSARR